MIYPTERRSPLRVREAELEPQPEPDPSSHPAPSPTSEPPQGEAPVPDPFTDADALSELEERITTLSAHIQVAEYRLLLLIAEFDRRRGWELGGHRSCAHWLAYRTQTELRTAREKVRVARVATAECEEELLEVARSTTAAQLEVFVRGWRMYSRGGEEALERERYRLRRFAVVPDEEGMYEVRGRVPAEVGVVLMRAVEAAEDGMFRKEAREETTAKQRRADALGLVAQRALAAGFGGEGQKDAPREGASQGEGEAASGDGPKDGSAEPSVEPEEGCGCGPSSTVGCGEAEVPVSGSEAERYTVFLHLGPETLREEGEPGRSHLEDGTRLAAESARRLACDAGLVPVIRGAGGEVLDLGRKRRTVSPALRRALELRDRGCRWPECGLRFTHVHHIRHWADGGPTSMDNCLLLCAFHHRKVHEGGWQVFLDRDQESVVFADPRGRFHAERPRTGWRRRGARERQAGGDPREDAPQGAPEGGSAEPRLTPSEPRLTPSHSPPPLVQKHRREGIDPNGGDLTPRYKRLRDVPWPTHAQALEALDRAHFGG